MDKKNKDQESEKERIRKVLEEELTVAQKRIQELEKTVLKILGVYLTNGSTNLHDLNIAPQLTGINNLTSIWKLQDMTPYGCITIAKTFLISQLTYKVTLVPTVKVNTKELQNN